MVEIKKAADAMAGIAAVLSLVVLFQSSRRKKRFVVKCFIMSCLWVVTGVHRAGLFGEIGGKLLN
jgi:uncharacterized membrane protein